MQWQEVCENPSLQNLPFKIELNTQGQLLMTPVKVNHSLIQGKIIGLLYQHIQMGEALAECAIKTSQGTKVADVAWASKAVLNVIQSEVECSIAPEICIEVMSMSNSLSEMAEKKALYFACSAQEVWICSDNGDIAFYAAEGELNQSKIALNFPHKIL